MLTQEPSEFDFLKSEPTQIEVGGRLLNFYPLSVGMSLNVRTFGKPIATALSMLLAKDSTDTGKVIKSFQNVKDGLISEETQLNAIEPAVLKFRTEQQQTAITQLVDALTDPLTMSALIALLVDSLRDEFQKGATDKARVEAFKASLDLPTIVELTKGMVAANKRAFGPLMERLTAEFQRISPQSQPQASLASTTTPKDASDSTQSVKPNLKAVPLTESSV